MTARVLTLRRLLALLALAASFVAAFYWIGAPPAQAGGPLVVGGAFGPDGQPFTWSAAPIQYNTDGGMLGMLNNATANARVVAMFDTWQAVSTATISYNRAGSLTGAGFDGDITDVPEYNTFDCGGANVSQNPIIYDTDGSIFAALGFDSSVIGFAGPCSVSGAGTINNGRAALNGDFIDGGPDDLSTSEFNGVFIHEFGHFSGLDHDQINENCLFSLGGCAGLPDTIGLPTMFPILLQGLQE
ncbi:MAG: hypothetical protein ACE5HB_01845, partial [Terriglobia bacterium]